MVPGSELSRPLGGSTVTRASLWVIERRIEVRTKRIDPEKPATARNYGQTPDVSIDVTIDRCGVQFDAYIDGECAQIQCRDFPGKAPKSVERMDLIDAIWKAVNKWRNQC